MMTSMVNLLTGFFESIIVVMFIDTFIDSNNEFSTKKYLLATIGLSILINLSNMILDLGLPNFIFMIVSTFIIAYIYKREVMMSVIISIISILILAISEIIVLFLVTLILQVSVKDASEVGDYVILGTVLSKLFAFIIFKILCIRHKKYKMLKLKASYWMLFLTISISSVITIFLIYRLQYESQSILLYNLSVWCSVGLLYSTFFSLYLYERISKQAELERKEEIFSQQIKAQSKHLDEILITQKEIKKLRHDLTNHIISIQAFFEKKDYAAGIEYITTMKGLTQFVDTGIETGNIALDAILNTKKSIALSKGINFTTNIQIPENIFVDAIDICIIFGNALDNCIEACERSAIPVKNISVSIIYEDDSIICKIINTASKGKNKFLQTVKKDEINHGFGISNIESALDRYKNVCRFKQTDDEFILSFIIFKS